MRLLGLSLCLVACTLENPAFFVEPPDSDAGTDPTRPGPGTTALTTGPHLTTGDGDTSTGLSATSTTGLPPMTATSEPSDTDTGPAMCDDVVDKLGPRVTLLSQLDQQPITADACAEWQHIDYHGKLFADPDGFDIKKANECDVINNSPLQGLRVALPLPFGPVAGGSCVSLRFTIHPGYASCVLSSFEVRKSGVPVLWGSFGGSEFPPDSPLAVGLAPTATCECPGCCPGAPDPDLYRFVVDMTEVDEGTSPKISRDGNDYIFSNLRSHIHGAECQGDLLPAEWLHFDWLVTQIY